MKNYSQNRDSLNKIDNNTIIENDFYKYGLYIGRSVFHAKIGIIKNYSNSFSAEVSMGIFSPLKNPSLSFYMLTFNYHLFKTAFIGSFSYLLNFNMGESYYLSMFVPSIGIMYSGRIIFFLRTGLAFPLKFISSEDLDLSYEIAYELFNIGIGYSFNFAD